MDWSAWRERFRVMAGFGAPRLVDTKVLDLVRKGVRAWGHPWGFVGLAEWLRLCAVQARYARRKEIRMQQFQDMTCALPPNLQALGKAQLISFFAGNLLLKETLNSPATISTYIGEAAAALDVPKRARPIKEVLSGLGRMWIHTPRRAVPVEPAEAFQFAQDLPEVQRVLAWVWISNGARQGDLEHLLFEGASLELGVVQGEAVLVMKLNRRKGALTTEGPRPELSLAGPIKQLMQWKSLLQGVLHAPVEYRRGLFESLVRWRQGVGLQAHSIRRGTAAWMSTQGAPMSVVAGVLGHAAEVRKDAVTQGYVEGRSWQDRLLQTKAQPRGW